MSRIAVVGSRNASSEMLNEVALFVGWLPRGTTVVSGGAYGVDSEAADCALSCSLSTEELFPQYQRYGKRAPLVRNEEIARRCDGMVAFWDGKSRGTMHAVNCARRLGKPVWIWEVPHARV